MTRAALSKPKRPLSAYNLFFQLERKRILAGTDGLGLPIMPEDIRQVIVEHRQKPKRKHRRSHGKISFRELARTIANRWKKISKETRQVLLDQAVLEKNEYEKDLRSWQAFEEGMAKRTATNSSILEAGGMQTGLFQDGKQALSSRVEVLQRLRNQAPTNSIGSSISLSSENLVSTFEANQALRHQNTSAFIDYKHEGATTVTAIPSGSSAANWEEGEDCDDSDLIEPISVILGLDESALPRTTEGGDDRHLPVLQHDMGSMMESPIFRDASLAGFDLLDIIGSDEMDSLFSDDGAY